MYAIELSPPMMPITIILSCGTLFRILMSRASRNSRRIATSIGATPGMHATTTTKSKLFHARSGPQK